ncbi:hypothetical protein EON65_35105 [archaeon]|nr:MAG: hypothetical protein EON65_35105 [archaeon]
MFRALIDGTYRQLYGEGLTLLALRIRSIVAEDLFSWTVKEKVQMEYDEFMHMIRVMREHIDEHLEDIIKTLFIRKYSVHMVH